MSGKIKSTVDETKDIEPLFDYGDITEKDKSVVKEVIDLIKARPGVPSEVLIAEIKEKFKIVEIPTMDLESSIWYQLTKDAKMGFAMQGYREDTDKDGKKIRIPHIGFSADLDYLDEFAQELAKKIQSIPLKTDK